MHVDDAIRGRRTVHRFEPGEIPRATIGELLDLAVRAPNHRLSEPWQFHVLTGTAQAALARLQQRLKTERHDDPTSAAALSQGEAAFREFTAPACTIVVSSTGKEQAHWKQVLEDYAATCCAIQNLMLAAWARGIGCHWRTGPITFHPDLFALTGLDPARQVVALLQMGRFASVPPDVRRTPAADKTVWVGS